MHYIRLLRPPHASPPWYDDSDLRLEGREGISFSLVLAITTDLGDELLAPARPLELVVQLVSDWDWGHEEPDGEPKKHIDPSFRRPGVLRDVYALKATPSRPDGGGRGHGGGGGGGGGNKNGKSSKRKTQDADRSGGGRRPDADTAVVWHAGARVLKLDVALDEHQAFEYLHKEDPGARKQGGITIRRHLRIAPADAALAVEHVQDFAGSQPPGDRIVPLWIDSPPPGPPVPGGTGFRSRVTFPPVAFRRLYTGPRKRDYVEVEEDIDESIARHVWDAGLAGLAFATDACRAIGTMGVPMNSSSSSSINAVADALRAVVLPPPPDDGEEPQPAYGAPPAVLPALRVLELGSGVGILGIGLAAVVPRLTGRRAAVLLTDLPDAETHLLANIARAAAVPLAPTRDHHSTAQVEGATDPAADSGSSGSSSSSSSSALAYEALDWEDGRHGRFGPRAAVARPKPGSRRNARRPWDLVVLSDCTYNVDVLPALVETLAALHAAARRVEPAFVSHALLFRKPRHADEEALFGLLAQHGWAQAARSTVPLPGGGDEPGGAMEVYLYRCP